MPGAIRAWLSGQIREIAQDRVLRLYGVALAYVNALTFVYWYARRDLTRILGEGSTPICWPFWEDCHAWRVLTPESISVLLWIYLALSLAAGACFFSKRRVAWGYWGLVAVNAIRIAIMAQDFTLRLNQHYMANWAALAFLFFPHRRVLVPALLVSFYFWAGALKLDMEWLSGAALYHKDKLWVPAALVPASCVYVVVLEMVLIFGLYARRSWIFWLTIAQLVLFHIYSWPIVGFFYPMLMFGLASIFVTIRLFGSPEPLNGPSDSLDIPLAPLNDPPGPRNDLSDLRNDPSDLRNDPPDLRNDPPDLRNDPSDRWMSARDVLQLSMPALLLLGGFAASQLAPIAFPGDSAITGEGRLFALNMFDARVVCHGSAMLHTEDGRSRKLFLSNKEYSQRISCDPVLFFNLARKECRRRSERKPAVVDFDLSLRSRRSTEREFRDVIDIASFCASGVTYDMWRPNDWILK